MQPIFLYQLNSSWEIELCSGQLGDIYTQTSKYHSSVELHLYTILGYGILPN